MSCSGNRCNMSVGGSGGTNNPIPPAQHTPYPAGANSASDAARINGNNNVSNQTELGAAFKGGSGGGRIVVPQHQEISASQSGNQGANQTSASTAQSLSQGHENAKMDHLVGGRKRRRTRKYRRSNKSTYKRRKRNTKRKQQKRKSSKSRHVSKSRKSLKRGRKTTRGGAGSCIDPTRKWSKKYRGCIPKKKCEPQEYLDQDIITGKWNCKILD